MRLSILSFYHKGQTRGRRRFRPEDETMTIISSQSRPKSRIELQSQRSRPHSSRSLLHALRFPTLRPLATLRTAPRSSCKSRQLSMSLNSSNMRSRRASGRLQMGIITSRRMPFGPRSRRLTSCSRTQSKSRSSLDSCRS